MANITIYPYYFSENKGIRGEYEGNVLLLRGLPKNKGFQGIDCVELAGSVAGQARNDAALGKTLCNFVEIRRISMWITPCKHSATRGMKPSISSELRRSSMYNGYAQVVELLRSSKWYTFRIPELRYAYTGLSTFNSYGVI